MVRQSSGGPDEPLYTVAIHAVLAHTFRIPTASAEVGLGVLAEGRPTQENRRVFFEDGQCGFKSDSAALEVDAGRNGVSGSQRINLPHAALCNPYFGPIVVDGAQVSVAAPRRFNGIIKLAHFSGIVGEPPWTVLLFDDRRQAREDVIQEESKPDAFASALATDFI